MNRSTSVAMIAIAGAFLNVSYAEPEAAAPSAAPAPAAPEVSEEELTEMLGYLTVFQAGLKQLGFTAKDAPAIAKGIERGLATEGDMPDQAILAKMPAFQEFIGARAAVAQAAAEAEAAKAAEGKSEINAAFFAEIKGQEGVEVSESGLHYKIIEPGEGEKPVLTDEALVHYKGTLIDGTQFDSSYDRGAPATFGLNQVVKGFGEGLTKIAPGGKIILYIPAELGYGNSPRQGGAIQPGDALIFECELLEVN
ncbi:MAG: FKBP-type peptidyl-prolyl cis-trans isomerase [Opitutaceae bacterium]